MVSPYRPKSNFTLKSLFRSRIFLFVLAFVLLITLTSLGREWWRSRAINKEIAELEKNIEELKKNNEDLQNQQKVLSDDYYIEKEARLRLARQKPGEQVVVLTNGSDLRDNTSTPNGSNQEQGVENNNSNWQLWLNYFFKNKELKSQE